MTGNLIVLGYTGGPQVFTGPILAADGSASAPGIAFASETGTGLFKSGTGILAYTSQGTAKWVSGGAALIFDSAYQLSWASGDPTATSRDTILVRDAANTLAQRNGTNAQKHKWYASYTDASNNAYGKVDMGLNGTDMWIGTDKVGGASAGALTLFTAGNGRWKIDTSGNLAPMATLATNMTNGFSNIVAAAGAPSGTPGNTTGVPLYFDTTNLKLYAYTGGAWKASAAFT